MDRLIKDCPIKPSQKWEIYLKCSRDWHFAMQTKQEASWLIWSIYHTHGISSSELAEQIHAYFREKNDILKISLLLEYWLSPPSRHRTILERYQIDLSSSGSSLLLLNEFNLSFDLKLLHPELFKCKSLDPVEILTMLSRKGCMEKTTRILTLKVVEYLLASYLIYLDLSFFVDLVFWKAKKIPSWFRWSFQIPTTDKVISIYLPCNLLLPLFWIEIWIMGYHSLKKIAQRLLNIDQLPSHKALLASGTKDDYLMILETNNLNSLKLKLNNSSSFQKLLLMEIQSTF